MYGKQSKVDLSFPLIVISSRFLNQSFKAGKNNKQYGRYLINILADFVEGTT